jgi:hypothetical protein
MLGSKRAAHAVHVLMLEIERCEIWPMQGNPLTKFRQSKSHFEVNAFGRLTAINFGEQRHE